MPVRPSRHVLGSVLLIVIAAVLAAPQQLAAGTRSKVTITSTLDGTEQPCYVIMPDALDGAAAGDADAKRVPLLVSLHTWSGGVEQRDEALEEETARRRNQGQATTSGTETGACPTLFAPPCSPATPSTAAG